MDGTRVQTALTKAGYPCGRIDGAMGKLTYGALFAYAAGAASTCSAELGVSAVTAFPLYGCDTPRKICFAIAEVSHETGNYAAWEEDFSGYTAKNLLDNWGPGKGGRIKSLADAQALIAAARTDPDAIPNRVYARPEYGNTNPGDGARYKGRGANMQTFKCNYQAAQDHTGVQFVAHPELMAQPGPSLLVAAFYWQSRGCWAKAEKNDPAAWRSITNGGVIGLPDFTARTKRLLGLF